VNCLQFRRSARPARSQEINTTGKLPSRSGTQSVPASSPSSGGHVGGAGAGVSAHIYGIEIDARSVLHGHPPPARPAL